MPFPLNDVTVYGVALCDQGFTEWNTIDGYGLNTFGFIWGCKNIWFGPYYSYGLTASTSWTLFGNWSLAPGWTLSGNWSLAPGWTTFSTYYLEDC